MEAELADWVRENGSRLPIIAFMASEREFWKNFCEGIGRPEMFTANPGAKYADHARGNVALRKELAAIFATRTTVEWVAFGQQVNTPICPVNTVKTIPADPQFQARMAERHLDAHAGGVRLPEVARQGAQLVQHPGADGQRQQRALVVQPP